MTEDQKTKHKILCGTKFLFFQNGFTKVTMDEIAASLRMSKKTLYRFFPSKEQLLREVLNTHINNVAGEVEKIITNDKIEYCEKLRKLFKFLGMQISSVGKPFISDLKNTTPEIWDEFDSFRQKHITSKFTRIIDEGIKKGILRKDINRQLLIMMYSHSISTFINPEMLTQLPYAASEVFESILGIIFEGIFTDKGREKYNTG
ncbi:MAG: TetR/AcrR family transcriptional regulator [candidate division Zixibacteria bacterium]|nr:TetR/AcrR family transcriptional regulator [candidate division Zixibacteria bacterium]